MAFRFSTRSKENLATCRQGLQQIADIALMLNLIDFMVIEGHRGSEKQNEYFKEGKSKVPWPLGKHNTNPSCAFDIVPVIDGSLSWNKLHCCVLAGILLAVAKTVDIKLRWGGNWDMDGEPITDQDFQDLAHFELVT